MTSIGGYRKEEIEKLFRKHSIEALDTFVVVRRRNSFFKGLMKLLLSNLYYAMDSAVIRIIAATDECLVIVNPTIQVVGTLETLSEKHIKQIPWQKVENFSVNFKPRTAVVSWTIAGKTEIWTADVDNPGIWHFNPANIQKLMSYTSNKV